MLQRCPLYLHDIYSGLHHLFSAEAHAARPVASLGAAVLAARSPKLDDIFIRHEFSQTARDAVRGARGRNACAATAETPSSPPRPCILAVSNPRRVGPSSSGPTHALLMRRIVRICCADYGVFVLAVSTS